MSYLPGKFVWFEHVSNDVAKARAFYEPFFNWHVERITMGDGPAYSMIHNNNVGIGGLHQAEEPGTPAHWQSYVSVTDVNAVYDAALAAGAKSVSPPTDFGQVGRGATLADPTGATFSLWRSADADSPDPEVIPIGEWYWNELWTTDVQKALAFYERVIGYTVDKMDMGPDGAYYLLKTGEKSRAGVTPAANPGAPSMWLPYVGVDDCDAKAAQAKKLGAQVLFPPHDIPGVGRFSILLDPLGAALAIIKATPGAA
jgi:uncharacterized protein